MKRVHLLPQKRGGSKKCWNDTALLKSRFWCVAFPAMLLSFLMLVVTTTETAAQSGTAFRDFDGSGTKSATEPGVQGIVVKLYTNATLPAKDQLIGTAFTNASGVFNFATNLASGRAANPGELVRVEFEIPNSFEW